MGTAFFKLEEKQSGETTKIIRMLTLSQLKLERFLVQRFNFPKQGFRPTMKEVKSPQA